MKQFKNTKALIFDFGGVLINLDKERCIKRFKKLGFHDIDNYLNNFVQTGIFLKLEKGQISATEFRYELRALLNKELTDEQIDHAWAGFLLNIPNEKLDILLELRQKFKVFMLSNTNKIHIDQVESLFSAHKGLSADDYFDKRYLSFEMGMAKPDEEIFTALLEEIKLSPEQCLFLDDGPANIEQAKKLGFQTYLVTPEENLQFLLNPQTWQ